MQDTRHYGPICGVLNPDLNLRTSIHGEQFTPITCTARHDINMGVVVPHRGKHRAHLGRHLIRWN